MLKKNSLKKIIKRRENARVLCENYGFELRFFNGGGSGSIEQTLQDDAVDELTVGSALFAGHLFDNYHNFKIYPALFFGLRITRKPAPGIFTAHSGGYIASGAVNPLKQPKPYLPDGMKLFANEGMGEVQTPVRISDFDGKIGDPLFFRPSKSGEICERFNSIHILSEQGIKEFPTYRGSGFNFG